MSTGELHSHSLLWECRLREWIFHHEAVGRFAQEPVHFTKVLPLRIFMDGNFL